MGGSDRLMVRDRAKRIGMSTRGYRASCCIRRCPWWRPKAGSANGSSNSWPPLRNEHRACMACGPCYQASQLVTDHSSRRLEKGNRRSHTTVPREACFRCAVAGFCTNCCPQRNPFGRSSLLFWRCATRRCSSLATTRGSCEASSRPRKGDGPLAAVACEVAWQRDRGR